MPFELVFSEKAEDRPSALRREAAIKKLKRPEKEILVKHNDNR